MPALQKIAAGFAVAYSSAMAVIVAAGRPVTFAAQAGVYWCLAKWVRSSSKPTSHFLTNALSYRRCSTM